MDISQLGYYIFEEYKKVYFSFDENTPLWTTAFLRYARNQCVVQSEQFNPLYMPGFNMPSQSS